MALVWSYYSINEKVIDLLQRMSHKSRAYIYNADGLKGFLNFDFVDFVIKSFKEQSLFCFPKDGILKPASKW